MTLLLWFYFIYKWIWRSVIQMVRRQNGNSCPKGPLVSSKYREMRIFFFFFFVSEQLPYVGRAWWVCVRGLKWQKINIDRKLIYWRILCKTKLSQCNSFCSFFYPLLMKVPFKETNRDNSKLVMFNLELKMYLI